MKTVLITGFEPFGGESVNPSWLLAQALEQSAPRGLKLHALQLPTAFDASAKALRSAIKRVQPDAVICLGQAGGRAALSFERVAINCNDAPIPDNLGQQPSNEAIAKRGPVAYWSSLPIHAMVAESLSAGVAAEVSNTAGTFVCNHVFYALMRARACKPGLIGGFVHVPYIPEQSANNPMPLADMQRGMQAALGVLFTKPSRKAISTSGRIA
jgi:pyroglutamyl-peptidase